MVSKMGLLVGHGQIQVQFLGYSNVTQINWIQILGKKKCADEHVAFKEVGPIEIGCVVSGPRPQDSGSPRV